MIPELHWSPIRTVTPTQSTYNPKYCTSLQVSLAYETGFMMHPIFLHFLLGLFFWGSQGCTGTDILSVIALPSTFFRSILVVSFLHSDGHVLRS